MSPELLGIVESLPIRPTSGELLGALVRAERAGFERGLLHAAELQARPHAIDGNASPFLRRQAG